MNDRLKSLEDNVAELALFKKSNTLEDILKNRTSGWALRYGLLESIQIMIDISCHLVSKYNLGNPETYGQCIELLRKFKHIDENLEKKLARMVGLRNILAHEYTVVKVEKLYSMLDNLDDFRNFIDQVGKII